MDFEYTADQQDFKYEFREWLEETLPERWLEDEWVVPDEPDKRRSVAREWQRRLYEGGWACIDWPEEHGGKGVGPWKQSIYEQEIARVGLQPLDMAYGSGTGFVGTAIIKLGTEAQKERFLPPILQGEAVWVLGFSEPNAGSDVASLTTSAEERDDEFVINGQKIWTTGAHYADWCILVTRTDDTGTKHEGITVLLVDMDQEGITTEPIREATDERRFNQVYFDDAVAPRENVLGEVGDGWRVVQTVLGEEHNYSEAFELEQRHNELVEYCRNEKRNGVPLIQQSRVRRRLADLEIRIQACQLARYRNISQMENEGGSRPEGTLDMLVSEDLRVELEKFAHELQGPQAVLWDDSPNDGRWFQEYLWAVGFWIAGGTGDVLRNIIGEHALGLPQDPKSKTSHRTGDEPTE